MKSGLSQRLLKKGWSQEEIDYTMKLYDSAEENKSKSMKIFEDILYWLAIIIAIAGNMVIAVVLIPFMLMLNTFLLYLTVVFLGLGFGFLYDLLIRDLEKVTGKEMIVESVFIPALALISVGFMSYFGNMLAAAWNLSVQNPVIVGIVYAAAFIAPWILMRKLGNIYK